MQIKIMMMTLPNYLIDKTKIWRRDRERKTYIHGDVTVVVSQSITYHYIIKNYKT